MRGITLKELARFRGVPASAITKEEMQNLSQEAVAPIYHTNYWLASHCQSLPSGVNLMMFDHAVNRGNYWAADALQRTLSVEVDHIVGAKTLAAANRHDPHTLCLALHAAQISQYATLNPVLLKTFGKGWNARAVARLQFAVSMIPGKNFSIA
jgi:lysozyme family protein